MIYKYFGKPSLPTILPDCLLIADNKIQPIGKVYFFSNTRTLTVREFGGEWPTDIIMDNRRFCGYFSCRFNSNISLLGDPNSEYTIQSSSDYPIIYRLKNVVFSKINDSFNSSNSMQFIKFNCLDVEIISVKNSKSKDENIL